MKDSWKPEQYNKFKNQRAKPFWDLLNLTQVRDVSSVIDLGCGTGDLTKEMLSHFPAAKILGIDASPAMLKESARFEDERLRFELQDLAKFNPKQKFDLVFSNAALQWLPDHVELFPKIFSWVSDHGQIAIQIPYNFEHPSHQIAQRVAENFAAFAGNPPPLRRLLPMEQYAQMLYHAGFRELTCRIEAYFHPMDSGRDVIEWTKGTLLTSYEKVLSQGDFADFLGLHQKELLAEIGEGPYLYIFKRLLLWGKRL